MKYSALGKTGEQLSVTGSGCMGMNYTYSKPNDKGSIATLHKAPDPGINFWNTAALPHLN